MLPFMVGTAFLTNVFYLPYLGLRRTFDDAAAAAKRGEGQDVSAKEMELAEGKGLPIAMLGVFAASVLWACFGRGAEYGDVATRMSVSPPALKMINDTRSTSTPSTQVRAERLTALSVMA